MSYIKKKNVIDGTPFEHLKVDVLAVDENEMQIQIERGEYDDFYFDLSVENAVRLRDSLNEFIAGRQ